MLTDRPILFSALFIGVEEYAIYFGQESWRLISFFFFFYSKNFRYYFKLTENGLNHIDLGIKEENFDYLFIYLFVCLGTSPV